MISDILSSVTTVCPVIKLIPGEEEEGWLILISILYREQQGKFGNTLLIWIFLVCLLLPGGLFLFVEGKYHSTRVEVRGQHAEVGSLLPPCESQGSNSDLPWHPVLLPAEPSHWLCLGAIVRHSLLRVELWSL